MNNTLPWSHKGRRDPIERAQVEGRCSCPLPHQAVREVLTRTSATAFELYVQMKSLHWHLTCAHFPLRPWELDAQAERFFASLARLVQRLRAVSGTAIEASSKPSRLPFLVSEPGAQERRVAERVSWVWRAQEHVAAQIGVAMAVCDMYQDEISRKVLSALFDELVCSSHVLRSFWEESVQSPGGVRQDVSLVPDAPPRSLTVLYSTPLCEGKECNPMMRTRILPLGSLVAITSYGPYWGETGMILQVDVVDLDASDASLPFYLVALRGREPVWFEHDAVAEVLGDLTTR